MIIGIPGKNGLGHTNGVESAPLKIKYDLKLQKLPILQLNSENITEQNDTIYNETSKLLNKNEQINIIGGDHSISYPIGKAFLDKCKKLNKNPFLIIFDAHVDCMPPMKEPTHEEWLRALIEYGFPKENIMIIGARNIEPDEQEYIENNKIRIIRVEDARKDNLLINKYFKKMKNKELYISFDIDVFDSSVVKATGYPSENGFTEIEVISILNNILKIKNKKCMKL